MSAIFISHSSGDNALAGELKARLAEQGHRSVFLDFDPEDGIPAGRDWERELYARLRGCHAVIVLCSEQSMASRWCFAEIAFARSLGKALLPIKIDGCAIPSAFTDVQTIDFRGDREQGYQRLWSGLRQAGLDPAGMFDWDGSRPPYPGLMVFQEQDAAVYFGRRAEIQATIEKLNRMQRLGDMQLAMVLGASGSGKSSLLRAGVIPRLKRDRARWLVPAPVRPLGQPFERLAMVLAEAFKSGTERPWKEIRERLAQPPADTAAAYVIDLANDLRAASGQPEATLLLGIDQFEELLTASEGDAEDRFLKLMRALVEARSRSVVVIGTLRSDFLGNFQNHPALRGLVYEPIDLPQLSVDAFAEIVEGPARLAGLELEAGLIGAIVADAATDDALPLLAFALRELWEARGADGRLTIDRYRNALGGLQGSVAKAADGLYPKAFTSREQERDIRNAFLAMVRVDAGGAYVRKPARWGELTGSAHGLLERFVQGRLLVSRGEGTDRILEVAHEALIRRWNKLRTWVEEDREYLRTRERVEVAAGHWVEAGRDASLLLPRGRSLAEAQELLVARRADLAPSIKEFVEASLAVKRAQDEEERKIQQERLDAAREREASAQRLARRTRLAAIGIGLFAILAVGFGVYAMHQADVAVEQRSRALTTQSRFLASLSKEQTDQGRAKTGILLALEALPDSAGSDPRPYVVEAEAALYHAVQRPYDRLVLNHGEGWVEAVALSADGGRLVTVATNGRTLVWDAASGELMSTLQEGIPRFSSSEGVSVAFNHDGTRVLAVWNRVARLWDTLSGKEIRNFGDSIYSAAFSPDGRRVVTGSGLAVATVWDAVSGGKVDDLEGHEHWVTWVAFAPDNRQVVTVSADSTVRLWDPEKRSQPAVLHPIGYRPQSAVFTGDSTGIFIAADEIVTTSDGSRVGGKAVLRWNKNDGDVFDVAVKRESLWRPIAISPDASWIITITGNNAALVHIDSRQERPLSGHQGAIRFAAFSPDGKWILTGSEDSTARIYDIEGKELAVLRGHDGFLSSGAISSDAEHVVTGDVRGAHLWTVSNAVHMSVLRRDREDVLGAAFNADGKRVITAASDGVHVWDAVSGQYLESLPDYAVRTRTAAFSPRGDRIVTGSDEGEIRIWDADTYEDIKTFAGEGGPVFSLRYSDDGTKTLSALWNGTDTTTTVRVWDAANIDPVVVRPALTRRGRTAEFSPDGAKVIIFSDDEAVRLVDLTAESVPAIELGANDEVLSADFSPDGRLLAIGWANGSVELLDAVSGERVRPLGRHANRVSDLSFSSYGQRLLTASWDGTACLWDVASGNRLAILAGHGAEVWRAEFSPDGNRIGTASNDGTARVWDGHSGKELVVLDVRQWGQWAEPIYGISFSSDNSAVITRERDTARLWRTFPNTQALTEYAHEIVRTQRLSADERRAFFLEDGPAVAGPAD